MKNNIRVLFVGHLWNGSSARSLREALSILNGVEMDDVGEDLYLPRYRSKPLRILNRAIKPLQRKELEHAVLTRLDVFRPDVLIVYKGNGIGHSLVDKARQKGVLTVNVFPDCSPHAFGNRLKSAMGAYDLVISTKPFHPEGWAAIYGYENLCVCVPHGYDPAVHLWNEPPGEQPFDVVLAASWRPEYEELMHTFGTATADARLRVGVAGAGWNRHKFPAVWEFVGPLTGRSYGQWLRSGKIAIAPVHTNVIIDNVRQPGDQDTTRTYELAAAWTFFLHKRTPFVQTLYDEKTEVPMWDDAKELASKVLAYLPKEDVRRQMAATAHARAVPSYSIPARAEEVLHYIRQAKERSGS